MKKSALLFSAAIAVIIGSSFTQANTSRSEILSQYTIKEQNSPVSVGNLDGYKNNIVFGTAATAFPGPLNNTVLTDTTDSSAQVIVSGPGTGTGTGVKETKLERLIKNYK